MNRIAAPMTLDHLQKGSNPADMLRRHRHQPDRVRAAIQGMAEAFRKVDAGNGECCACSAPLASPVDLACVSVAVVSPGADVPSLSLGRGAPARDGHGRSLTAGEGISARCYVGWFD
jgi:hypothetical protein